MTIKKDKQAKINKLQKFLVEYTGKKQNPSDGNITVQMILEQIAKEFPELILDLAEQNFFQGYTTACDDIKKVTEDQIKINEQAKLDIPSDNLTEEKK